MDERYATVNDVGSIISRSKSPEINSDSNLLTSTTSFKLYKESREEAKSRNSTVGVKSQILKPINSDSHLFTPTTSWSHSKIKNTTEAKDKIKFDQEIIVGMVPGLRSSSAEDPLLKRKAPFVANRSTSPVVVGRAKSPLPRSPSPNESRSSKNVHRSQSPTTSTMKPPFIANRSTSPIIPGKTRSPLPRSPYPQDKYSNINSRRSNSPKSNINTTDQFPEEEEEEEEEDDSGSVSSIDVNNSKPTNSNNEVLKNHKFQLESYSPEPESPEVNSPGSCYSFTYPCVDEELETKELRKRQIEALERLRQKLKEERENTFDGGSEDQENGFVRSIKFDASQMKYDRGVNNQNNQTYHHFEDENITSSKKFGAPVIERMNCWKTMDPKAYFESGIVAIKVKLLR